MAQDKVSMKRDCAITVTNFGVSVGVIILAVDVEGEKKILKSFLSLFCYHPPRARAALKQVLKKTIFMGVLSDGCPINKARLNHMYADHAPLVMITTRLSHVLADRAPSHARCALLPRAQRAPLAMLATPLNHVHVESLAP
jgi:hypothetical protein